MSTEIYNLVVNYLDRVTPVETLKEIQPYVPQWHQPNLAPQPEDGDL